MTSVLFVYLKFLWQSENEILFTKKKLLSPSTTSAVEVWVHSQEFPTSVELELKMPWTNRTDPQPDSLVPQGKFQLTISVTVCWCFPVMESRGGEGEGGGGWMAKEDRYLKDPYQKRYCWQHRGRNAFVGVQWVHKFHFGNIFVHFFPSYL